MANNRHLIDDYDIVRPALLLDKGLPLPLLGGRHRVDEGCCAVITEGGAFKEIIGPGTHSLSRYSMFRDVQAIQVDTRIQTLNVSTAGEFTIAQPVPVKINLDLGVEYRVSDPRRVALEIKTPLTSLYDRVIQAVRGIIVNATYDEFRTQGEMIAQSTLLRLQGMQLPKQIGIEVLNVLVTSITGADPVAQQQISEYTAVRQWQLDNTMLHGTQVTPEWLMVNRPELYAQMMADQFDLTKTAIEKGWLDPARVLNEPLGGGTSSFQGGFSGLNVGLPALSGQGGTQPPPLISPPSQPTTKSTDVLARIKEDLSYLRGMAGIQAEARARQGDMGLPDGTYWFKVEIPLTTGETLTLDLDCPVGYPKVSPGLLLKVNGTETIFESAILRNWKGQYLVEIVREIRRYYGG